MTYYISWFWKMVCSMSCYALIYASSTQPVQYLYLWLFIIAKSFCSPSPILTFTNGCKLLYWATETNLRPVRDIGCLNALDCAGVFPIAILKMSSCVIYENITLCTHHYCWSYRYDVLMNDLIPHAWSELHVIGNQFANDDIARLYHNWRSYG